MKILIKSYSLNYTITGPVLKKVNSGKWYNWTRTLIVENRAEMGYAAISLNMWERFISIFNPHYISKRLQIGRVHRLSRSSLAAKISKIHSSLQPQDVSESDRKQIRDMLDKRKNKAFITLKSDHLTHQKETYETVLRELIMEGKVAGYILNKPNYKIYYDENKLPKDEMLVNRVKLDSFHQKVDELRKLPPDKNFTSKESEYFRLLIEKLVHQYEKRFIHCWKQAFVLPESALNPTQKAKVLDYLIKNQKIEGWTLDEKGWYARLDENDLIIEGPSDQWRDKNVPSNSQKLCEAEVLADIISENGSPNPFLSKLIQDLNHSSQHNPLYYELEPITPSVGSETRDEILVALRLGSEKKHVYSVQILENPDRIIVYPTARSAFDEFMARGKYFHKALWVQVFSKEEMAQLNAIREKFKTGITPKEVDKVSEKLEAFLKVFFKIEYDDENQKHIVQLPVYKIKDF